MTVASALERIQQLEAMLSAAQAGNPDPSAAPAGFSQQLADASVSASSPAGVAGSVGAIQAPAGGGLAGDAAGATAAASGTQYQQMIGAAAAKYGLDPALLSGLIKQESGFDPNARSAAGAEGLTQLMPGTAAALGVSNPFDPAQSIDGGARYLREQLDSFGGDVSKALAAYNAGAGAVQQYGGVPPYPETQNYVQQVLANASQYGGGTSAGAMA